MQEVSLAFEDNEAGELELARCRGQIPSEQASRQPRGEGEEDAEGLLQALPAGGGKAEGAR
jgi:hypothetical protein